MEIAQYLSIASKKSTSWVLELSEKVGIPATTRWASLVVLFLSLLLIYLSTKIVQPLLKWALILVGILIIIGLLFPW